MTDTTSTPSRPGIFQRHPKTTVVVVVFAGIALSLAIGELLARALLPQWAPIAGERVTFWAYDDTLGWAHRPGQYGRLTHPDFEIDVCVNSAGLRDDEYPLERTSRRRMLVLGDSFGWGFGVEHDERFSEIIEHRHPDWEVINASVSGYGTDQELLYLRGGGLRLAPDVVLLLFHANDFDNNTRSAEYWYSKPYFELEGDDLVLRNTPVPRTTLRQRCNRFFYGHTYLLARIYSGVGGLTRELRRSRWSRDHVGTEGAAVTAALLSQMNRECRSSSARLVLASVPMDDASRNALAAACAGEGIPYLPLESAFAAAGGGLTFEHDGHWTPKGHRTAADAVDRFLDDIGVFSYDEID